MRKAISSIASTLTLSATVLLFGGAISAPRVNATEQTPTGSSTTTTYEGQRPQGSGTCAGPASSAQNREGEYQTALDKQSNRDVASAADCSTKWQQLNSQINPEQKNSLNAALKTGDSSAVTKVLTTLGVDASSANQLANYGINLSKTGDSKSSADGKVNFAPITVDKRTATTTIDSRVDATRPIDAVQVGKSDLISFDVPVLQCGADGTLRQVASTRMSVPAKSKAGSLSVGIPFVFNIGGSLSVNGTISGEAESVSALGRKLTMITQALAWANMDASNPTVLLGLDFNYRSVKNANDANDPLVKAYLDAMKKASRVCGNVPFYPPVVPPTGNTPPPSTPPTVVVTPPPSLSQACFTGGLSGRGFVRTWNPAIAGPLSEWGDNTGFPTCKAG